jgi:ABC-type cobalamin/Fe3+-siderophores transport system ATPase subunit
VTAAWHRIRRRGAREGVVVDDDARCVGLLGLREVTEVWPTKPPLDDEPTAGDAVRGTRTTRINAAAGLSAGERQRVCLARAFLRDAEILLLDEPTANLDGSSEVRVLSALRRLVQGRTVILVAHRSALLALADDVVTLSAPERAVIAA